MPVSKAQERVNKGLCPRCGEEAAPYYLCVQHRTERRVARSLDRLLKQGQVTEIREGRQRAYKVIPNAGPVDNRWATLVGTTPEQDRRFAPRLRGVPVDVEAELIQLLKRIGIGVTIEEILFAWGRLRGERKRKHGSAAGDLRAIILAQRRREERATKRRP